MRKLIMTFAGIAVVLVTASSVALAQTPAGQPAPAGQYPKVSSLKSFSAEANFMSLPGYLRYLMHQQTGQWLTYAEASRAVRQQGAQ
jgi:hypothetical protein